ncbi:hypothetical protein JCM8208_000973 [Rhodotorula glutinis]
MHRFVLVFLALALALVATAVEVNEQFVLGEWSNGPEVVADMLAAHDTRLDGDDGGHWGCADADEPVEQPPAAAQTVKTDADEFFDLFAGFAKGFMGEGPDGNGGVWERRIVKGGPA